MPDANSLLTFPAAPWFEYLLDEYAKIMESLIIRDSNPPQGKAAEISALFKGMIKYELVRNGLTAENGNFDHLVTYEQFISSAKNVVNRVCESILSESAVHTENDHKVLPFKAPE